MKPVFLSIKGINSYEDKQEIDFARVSAGGLFGVFGPTGSGKSTILDAITLALYGRVSRYASNAQKQFMNSNSETAEVFLKFETESGAYCVHKAYKNAGGRARAVLARLYKTSGETEVIIADKNETDVTAETIKIVGMEYDDFARTVVLPQGKFSEFLTLTAKDRREALERIFNLEKYGEKLYAKIRYALNASKNSASALAQMISVYGELNEAVLSETEKTAAEKSERLRLLEMERGVKAAAAEKRRELRAVYESYIETAAKLEALLASSDAVNAKKLALSAARRAAAVAGIIKETANTRTRIKAAETEKAELSEAVKKARGDSDGAKSAHIKALSDKESALARIIGEEYKLEAAAEIFNEITALNQTILVLQNDFIELSDEIKNKKEKLAAYNETVKKAEDELASLAERKKRTAYSSAYRNAANDGANIERETEWLTEKAAALVEKAEKSKKIIVNNNKSLEKSRALLAKESAELTSVTNSAAMFLAKQLSPGEPCPVCGSTEHTISRESSAFETEDAEYAGAGRLYDYEAKINEIKIEIEREKTAMDKESAVYRENLTELEGVKREIETKRETAGIILKSLNIPGDVSFRELERVISANDAEREKIEAEELKTGGVLRETLSITERLRNEITELTAKRDAVKSAGLERRAQADEKKRAADAITGGADIAKYRETLNEEKTKVIKSESLAKSKFEKADERLRAFTEKLSGAETAFSRLVEILRGQEAETRELLSANGFADEAAALAAYKNESEAAALENEIASYEIETGRLRINADTLYEKLRGEADIKNIAAESEKLDSELAALASEITALGEERAVLNEKLAKMKEDLKAAGELRAKLKKEETRGGYLADIASLCRNNAFLAYVAKRQLSYVTSEATRRLKVMTNGRFALEIDNSEFVIRDDYYGTRRSPSSLSGGEVFIASLCLALALSTRIQMRTEARVSFFFLDEGFGSLDPNALDTVINALESLRDERMSVGLISHVEELKTRIQAKILVEPGERGAGGSRLSVEF